MTEKGKEVHSFDFEQKASRESGSAEKFET